MSPPSPSGRRAERRGEKEKGTDSIFIRKIPKSCDHFEQAAPDFHLDQEIVKGSLTSGSMQQELGSLTSQKMHWSLHSPVPGARPPSGQRRPFSDEGSSKSDLPRAQHPKPLWNLFSLDGKIDSEDSLPDQKQSLCTRHTVKIQANPQDKAPFPKTKSYHLCRERT